MLPGLTRLGYYVKDTIKRRDRLPVGTKKYRYRYLLAGTSKHTLYRYYFAVTFSRH